MKFKIRILSPLHIGCGESYSGLNYIIDDGRLYYLEPDVVFRCLDTKIGTYIQWLEKESNALTEAEELKHKALKNEKKELNKKANQIRNKFNLKEFCRSNQMPFNVIISGAAYQIDCMGKIFDSSEVQKFVCQGNRPYLPGSEIKGAMRTAIMHDLLKNDYQWIEDELRGFRINNQRDINLVKNQVKPNKYAKKRLNQNMAELAKKLEQRLLKSPEKNDAKYDLLKYLFVSDSELIKPETSLCVASAEPFNTSSRFQIYSEYIQPGIDFCFKDLSLENDLSKKTKLEKLNFSKKQKEMVSDQNKILRCCYDFSNDLLNEEIDFFTLHRKDTIVQHLRDIRNQNAFDSPVIRIGKDEGYLSLTVGLLVKQRDKNLYENVLIHTTKGKSYDSAHGGPLPKSRKIVYYAGEERTSGWVKLIFAETSPKITAKEGRASHPAEEHKKEKSTPPSSKSLNALKDKWGK